MKINMKVGKDNRTGKNFTASVAYYKSESDKGYKEFDNASNLVAFFNDMGNKGYYVRGHQFRRTMMVMMDNGTTRPMTRNERISTQNWVDA